MRLTVDVTSDVICPWCYIGKRQMEEAIAALPGSNEIRVRWHPFQLNPRMPADGVDRKTYRIAKFGSWERSQMLEARVAEAGLAVGLQFAFDRIERTPNTLDAHRLIALADELGVQDAVVEAIFRAYFIEGRDISNASTLLDIAADAGLDRGRAEALLAGDEGVAEIRAADEHARRSGVQGVPYFVVNDRVVIPGAAGTPAFLSILSRLEAEASGIGEGTICEIGGGAEC
ncbi:DsbA family oxidoreductase [Singulisphaera sp. PoT]|uniref:DsbA family oxidoreductase n=1 Tax=Singulisphaera sp. PoT TaxID=3411797 RepID=UPI003BF5E191